MSSLSRFTRANIRLFDLLKSEENIEEITNYMEKIILNKDVNIGIPIKIQNKSGKIFDKNEQISVDERFYFQNSPNLGNLMTHLYVCSECRIPVCLVGATGLGKTIMVRAFCEIVRRENPILYSFHMDTQLSDLYRIFNFETGKVVIQDGLLVKTVENGQIFIADEFNLEKKQFYKPLLLH